MCLFSSCIFPAEVLLGDGVVTSATGATVETSAQSAIEGLDCSAGQVLGDG